MLHYQPNKELGETTATALMPSDGSGPKLHVLLVQTQAENAGAQEISRLLGAGLTARGYRVTNLFFFRQSDSFDEPPNTFYCASSRPGNPLALLRMLWTLGRHIRTSRPDAVLTFQHFGNVIGAGVSRLVCRAPVIANQVSSALSMSWPVRAADVVMGSLGFFDRITLNSKDMQREYSRYPAAYRSRMVHVPHGFDDKALTLPKEAARQKFSLPPDRILLGCAARLHPHKRLDAAIRLLPDRPSWHLALAGQGADEARLRQLADELNVSDRLHLLGEIAPRQMADFLACLDVFVFPTQAETFGLAAVEAANAGVPSVVTDLPVLREVLSFEGKPTALFVDASDHAKLSTAVSRLLTDQQLSEELRQNAKGLRLRYSVDAMVEEYVRILGQVI
ncbi:glycosyltransferase family 4 protein [Bradyrhizobium sp. 180]|uniref:glycosyltransferase family 4 protein n=1 Tax=unclassified Bradyrhizobium TaxID=2631580 RepID=UPI001FF98CE7|nr:glycosyltransferase family 4 protein [Bradyrhizobium sp. CW12]MCK1494309.1 glycosyltransferase family 4 protein [Bradyrhizobium sp. 180]MCK1530492.1 glycosyltransferase family 4 protein [Bradyrhizobium sp. 182]MCK1615699.1 glycosyltransferase family 4 protein [Bradyrhizobium sp. 159]MCK1645515.1 glycosyltransferase family 4 protein [Bradyrhizobium sp. 154]MCK1663967.1 glycosyltransferase family 4 protein [Bradyrhizobium sp. 153]MCK1755996.1 glycosyltransferase family 4 protein [Bradyrhizob